MTLEEARDDAIRKGFTHVWGHVRHIPISEWSPYTAAEIGPVCLMWDRDRPERLWDVAGGRIRAWWTFIQEDSEQVNSRLIAAAPDLLEAARSALTEWTLHGSLTDTARILRAAIKKAEGIT